MTMEMYVPKEKERVVIQTQGDDEENFAATVLEVLLGERVRVRRKDGQRTARLTYAIAEINLTLDNEQRDRCSQYWNKREGGSKALQLEEISHLLHGEDWAEEM